MGVVLVWTVVASLWLALFSTAPNFAGLMSVPTLVLPIAYIRYSRQALLLLVNLFALKFALIQLVLIYCSATTEGNYPDFFDAFFFPSGVSAILFFGLATVCNIIAKKPILALTAFVLALLWAYPNYGLYRMWIDA